MNVETTVRLDRFQPRDYQLPILDAVLNKGIRGAIAVWPRRAGKDIMAFNLAIRYALKKVCVIYYILPTYTMSRKIIWDNITIDGHRIIDWFLPEELVESKNGQEMKIRLKNGSLIQFLGSDNADGLVGTNPSLCIFSEYALQDPTAYQFIRPILAANDGTAVFVSTPRGHNHFHQLFQMASRSKDWFTNLLTLDDTQHIPQEEIQRERDEGLISEDLLQQEYFCSFDLGIEGSYYSKYLDKMRTAGRISDCPWEAGFPVLTAWDLGIRDSTCIIFFQVIGLTVRIIDCYENTGVGLEHYIKVLQQKPYQYSKHFAPHDIRVREFGTGITRLEKGRQLGVNFTVTPDVGIEDGIEAVRSALSRIWIDEKSCKKLIEALESYHQEFNPKLNAYNGRPVHDWSSHYADTMRYLCVCLSKTREGSSPEDIDRRYNEVRGGNTQGLPRFFRDDVR
jgi:phage terminase large subunit